MNKPVYKAHTLQGEYIGYLECHIALGLVADLSNWRRHQGSLLRPNRNA